MSDKKEPLGLTELKSIQLDILQDVHDYCMKNGIRYSLAYGSLLGAIRHKGFIPWDDDIDIFMLRKDYEKFMTSYESGRYKQIFRYRDTGILYPFGKVYDSKTELIEFTNNSISAGVFIDIFPMDEIPEGPCEEKKLRKKLKSLIKLKIIKDVRINRRSAARAILLPLLKMIVSPIPYGLILRKYNAVLDHVNRMGSGILTDYNTISHTRIRIPSDSFGNLAPLKFEDREFLAFENADEVLTMLYGDYMCLPPIEQQITHHGFVAFMK